MRDFYRLSPDEQRRRSLKSLFKYIREYIFPYHPFLRKRYLELGLKPGDIRGYDDFLKLPVVTKADYRPDPRAFILQPKFPGREDKIPYDTERIHVKHLLRYIYQALFNKPKDYAHLFRKMPFFQGKVGRRAAWEWMPIHFHASAGTTGDPTPATYTYHDFLYVLPELASSIFTEPDNPDPNRPRVEWDSKNFNVFPGTPHLAFFQAVISKFLTGMASFDSCGGKVIPTEEQIRIFSQQEFDSISAVPSYMTYWLRTAVEMLKRGEIKPLHHLKGVFMGGEPVSPTLKQYFKDRGRELGVHPGFRVIGSFGMTEVKWAFMECEEDSGIHLNPKFYFWELLDPETRMPVGEGKPGVLVFSHIGWRGTVFIRYWTGDLVRGGIRWEKCRFCDRTAPLLFGSICRAVKDFTKIKGTRVNLLDLISAVRDTEGVSSFRIILDKEVPGDEFSRDVILVRVVLRQGETREVVEKRIKDHVKAVTEVTPDKVVFEVDEKALEGELFQKTGIKAEYLVDKRPTHI